MTKKTKAGKQRRFCSGVCSGKRASERKMAVYGKTPMLSNPYQHDEVLEGLPDV